MRIDNIDALLREAMLRELNEVAPNAPFDAARVLAAAEARNVAFPTEGLESNEEPVNALLREAILRELNEVAPHAPFDAARVLAAAEARNVAAEDQETKDAQRPGILERRRKIKGAWGASRERRQAKAVLHSGRGMLRFGGLHRTLKYNPPAWWRWAGCIPWMLPTRAARRTSVEEYLAPDEQELFVTRRHAIALTSTVVIWLALLTIGFATGLGAAVIPPATLLLGWRVWRWREAWYVLTDQRLLFVHGIVHMRVKGLPLESVLDATCQRSVAGRLLGYGDIRLRVNLNEQPGLRKLTRLPRPETFYLSILSLTAVLDVLGMTSPELHQRFEAELISVLPRWRPWEITGAQVRTWLE